MKLEKLKAHYQFYIDIIQAQIEEERYIKGFGYIPGSKEDMLAESEAVLRLIEEKEKRLN